MDMGNALCCRVEWEFAVASICTDCNDILWFHSKGTNVWRAVRGLKLGKAPIGIEVVGKETG